MTQSSVNWGILSTAAITQKWVIPALQQSENANLAAIASGSGKAKEVAAKYNIPKQYNSYEELLSDPEIDLVYIPLPNGLHAKWVKEAAKSGKHVLCEKPAALTADETREMIQVCEENHVLFMEALMYQFHPQHQRVKEIIDSGEIGEVKLMRVSLSFVLTPLEGNIRMSKELGGGSMYDLGCYCIHSIRNMMGSEPLRVYAVEDSHPTYDVDMSAVAMMELENGLKAVFDCGMNMSGLRQSYEVVGTKGKIDVPVAYVPPVDGKGFVQVATDQGTKREETILGYTYTLAIQHLSDCVLTGTEPRYTKEDCINNIKALEACLQSLQNGIPVRLKQEVNSRI